MDLLVEKLNFTQVKLKLQDKTEGLGWDEEMCESVEKEYKRFLSLKKTYPELDLVPNQVIDKFWHQHILDTKKYAEDCSNVFGYFLHHDPYFGMDGEESYRDLCDAFDQTKDLYALHFGESYSAKPYRCRTQCKPMKCK